MGSPTRPPRNENFEILGETAKLWHSNNVPQNDVIIKTHNYEALLAVGKLFFEDSYDYFDKFLRDAGMDEIERHYFKDFVFDQLARQDFLLNENALIDATSIALRYFYVNPESLLKLMKALEIEYNITVECGELELPKSTAIAVSNLQELVVKIFNTRRNKKDL